MARASGKGAVISGSGIIDEAMLGGVVEALCDINRASNSPTRRNVGQLAHPSSSVVIELVEALRSVLFPGYYGVSEVTKGTARYHVGATLDRVSRALETQIRRGLCFFCTQANPQDCEACRQHARHATERFIARLPEVRRLLGTDVQAAYEGDPAARSADEAIFCYPGLHAITAHRLAHELQRLEVPLIPRIISEHSHSVTGIDIHPGAAIGESFFIDHGTGVVVGETCRIGDRVRIYQGVTLGAKSFPLDEDGNPIKGIDRHPIVEDDVIIYSGATILGRVVIGRGSVIGGNVWLTRGVPAGSRVTLTQIRTESFEEGAGI